MSIKMMITAVILLSCIASSAQQKIELSTIKFTETPNAFLKDALAVHEGKLSGRDDMISYGIDTKNLTFKSYTPKHVELLTHKGRVAGYAFKITSWEEQQKLRAYLQNRYKNLSVQKSLWIDKYSYKDKEIVIDFRTVTKEKFADGATGYLDIKTAAFADAYEALMKR